MPRLCVVRIGWHIVDITSYAVWWFPSRRNCAIDARLLHEIRDELFAAPNILPLARRTVRVRVRERFVMSSLMIVARAPIRDLLLSVASERRGPK